jgi:hypothetical protein
MGHVFEARPAISPGRIFARNRTVSRLSSSFFGSLFFMATSEPQQAVVVCSSGRQLAQVCMMLQML